MCLCVRVSTVRLTPGSMPPRLCLLLSTSTILTLFTGELAWRTSPFSIYSKKEKIAPFFINILLLYFAQGHVITTSKFSAALYVM